MIHLYYHIAEILHITRRYAAQVFITVQAYWKNGHVILHTEPVRHRSKKPQTL